MAETHLPRNLIEAVRYFSDPEVCVQFVASLRWADGPICPQCGGREHSYLTTRRIWKCKNKECHKQFSVKVGTIFEDSALGLDKWLVAIWLIANSKNGISSHELARGTGMTQKSAWFVLHRIRLAMQTGTFEMLSGETEVDETIVGGKGHFMHASRKARGGMNNKTIVAGALNRSEDGASQVHAQVVPNGWAGTLQKHVHTYVEPGSTLYTDANASYQGLWNSYQHESVNHSAAEYVRGRVSTNGIENFWALLKRGIKGTYVQVAPEHVSRYVDERVFTFNNRDLDDLGRFRTVLERISGRRLTYAQLTS